MKKAALVFAVAFFIFWGLWIIAVPERFISGFIEDSLEKYSINIDLDGIEKGLFYSIGKKSVRISAPDNSLIMVIDNLKARINFASFLKLSPGMDFHGNVEKGKLGGNIRLEKGDWVARVRGNGIDIKHLPLVEGLFGIDGTGDIAFDLLKTGKRGEIKFSLSNANISGEGLLSLYIFKNARGEIIEENGLITIKSLAMEGNGTYARVKGCIRGNDRNLSMEIMVNSSSDLKPSYLAELEQFRVSPGYYVIETPGSRPCPLR